MAEGLPELLAACLQKLEEYLSAPVPQPVAQPIPQPVPDEGLNTPPCPTTPEPIELEAIEWGPLSPWQDMESRHEEQGNGEQLIDELPGLQTGPCGAALSSMHAASRESTTGKFSYRYSKIKKNKKNKKSKKK